MAETRPGLIGFSRIAPSIYHQMLVFIILGNTNAVVPVF
jgi:hypothetical protein